MSDRAGEKSPVKLRRKKLKVEPEVIDILAKSNVDDAILYLPEVQLERKLYEKVNKVLVILGGKWNRSKRGHIFEESPADAIDTLLLTGEIFDRKKEFQFFPTPPDVAEKICEKAEINKNCHCLEPSAGKGNIAEKILKHNPKSITVVEIDEKNAPYLQGKYNHCHICDFLEWQPAGLFDRIVMNPPFSKKQDIKHISRAWELLKPGGILVSILSPSPFFCSDSRSVNFRQFLDQYCVEVIHIDEGTFKESGTMIQTKCIKLVKT